MLPFVHLRMPTYCLLRLGDVCALFALRAVCDLGGRLGPCGPCASLRAQLSSGSAQLWLSSALAQLSSGPAQLWPSSALAQLSSGSAQLWPSSALAQLSSPASERRACGRGSGPGSGKRASSVRAGQPQGSERRASRRARLRAVSVEPPGGPGSCGPYAFLQAVSADCLTVYVGLRINSVVIATDCLNHFS
jgi:hypothetical protein